MNSILLFIGCILSSILSSIFTTYQVKRRIIQRLSQSLFTNPNFNDDKYRVMIVKILKLIKEM